IYFFFYCADDAVTIIYLDRHYIQSNTLPFTMQEELNQGAFIRNEEMIIKSGDETFITSIYDFALRGKHNQYNTMAAGIAALTLDLRKEKIREAIQSFTSLEHRMELVATVRGVEFINDSKATNINSTWYALESMTKPTILILGGIDKGNDYSLIKDLVIEKVKAIVCLGVDNQNIHDAFDQSIERIVDTGGAAEAVSCAYLLAGKGDVVLLSPACASFDLFRNYEDRGRQYKDAVMDL
ncbi:MAG: cyanophycin synthetase, partial [Chitinophagaceae bacterium]